jgi:hypothetical protein
VWEVKNGVRTLVLAGYFLGPELMDTARRAAGTGDRYIAWESVVVALESGDAGPGYN